MERLEAFTALRQAVAEVLAVEPDSVTEDKRLREDLGADSLDLIEIVTMLEDRLGVSLADEDFKQVSTISQALDLASNGSRRADGQ